VVKTDSSKVAGSTFNIAKLWQPSLLYRARYRRL